VQLNVKSDSFGDKPLQVIDNMPVQMLWGIRWSWHTLIVSETPRQSNQ